MLKTTGQTHHAALSNILGLLFPLISPGYKEWPTMPSSMAGFKSHILSPTNQHSVVSILPVPTAYMLPIDKVKPEMEHHFTGRIFVIQTTEGWKH
jgi:hypothetical protein